MSEWSVTEPQLFQNLETSPNGLTSQESRIRQQHGPAGLGIEKPGELRLLLRQFKNPTILILLGTAVVSLLLGQLVESSIIIAIVAFSGLLGFLQERSAVGAVHALLEAVRTHSEVIRDGVEQEVLSDDVVRGDVVVLRTGDVVPGDGRLITANRLLVDEATLTGESYPREKVPGSLAHATPRTERSNMVYCGTYITSGEGRMLVVRTGRDTELGRLATHVSRQHLPTSFERGITEFGYLLMRAMVVLVVAIFAMNLLLHRPVIDSILFSLALAIGLTPQMLPAIVTLSLSRGARSMASKRVIVKRLDAIEDIGGLDVLCVDKTGTITEGDVLLDDWLDPEGNREDSVLHLARLNSELQRGFSNPIDDAVLASGNNIDHDHEFVDEIPFDFSRRRMSVVARQGEDIQLVCKGAIESVLAVSTRVRIDGLDQPIASARPQLTTIRDDLASQGFRVLGVAFRSVERRNDYTPDDEVDLVFAGFLTFSDPPKAGIAQVVGRLHDMGVGIRIVTGDSPEAALHAARAIGLSPLRACTGAELDRVPADQLPDFVEKFGIFAQIDPIQKETIVRSFVRRGHAVGFLGDGINDAPALHAADVGISVTEAVDVAKQTADVVLLNKDLGVLATGIEEGRRVFANTLKYVHVTTSANFGNMLSLAAATSFLPYLPLLPLQILLLNFLSDVPGMTIATDRVEPEHLARPLRWDVRRVRNFMLVFGLMSTVFDLVTFASLRLVFSADAVALRSGWFVESMLNELLVLLMLRTTRPLWRSRPSPGLLTSSLVVAGVVVALPYSPLAPDLGLTGPDRGTLTAMLAITALSVAVTELLKRRFSSLVEPG